MSSNRLWLVLTLEYPPENPVFLKLYPVEEVVNDDVVVLVGLKMSPEFILSSSSRDILGVGRFGG